MFVKTCDWKHSKNKKHKIIWYICSWTGTCVFYSFPMIMTILKTKFIYLIFCRHDTYHGLRMIYKKTQHLNVSWCYAKGFYYSFNKEVNYWRGFYGLFHIQNVYYEVCDIENVKKTSTVPSYLMQMFRPLNHYSYRVEAFNSKNRLQSFDKFYHSFSV